MLGIVTELQQERQAVALDPQDSYNKWKKTCLLP